MLTIAPSILSADFAKLADEIHAVEVGGGDWIHVDVMDGHFVPNITFGPLVVRSIRPHTKLPLDVHLMIQQPDLYVAEFAAAGADIITIHAEACVHLHRSIQFVKEQGVQVGVALNPATPIEVLEHVLEDVDLVLIMTVNPGFGGQSFIPATLAKLNRLRAALQERKLQHIRVEVDGGIHSGTAGLVAAAGADVLVAGNAIFGMPDRAAAIADIRAAALKGVQTDQ